MNKLISGKYKLGSIPEKWEGMTGERMVKHLV